MQIIKKVLNSSVVLVADERGLERVLLGRGIGFNRKAGEVVPQDQADRVFIALDDADHRNLVELLAQIPAEYVELTRAIVAAAEESGIQLDPHIYLTLTDHLHFAVSRHREGLVVANRLAWEVRNVYPTEYAIGVRALSLMRDRLEVELPHQEAANIAFHLVNAELGRPAVDSVRVIGLISAIMTIVTNAAAVTIDRDDLHGSRFVIHLQFFAERLFGDRLLRSEDDFLFRTMGNRYPRSLAAAERVRSYIEQEHQVRIPDEELAYLALHIARAAEDDALR
ncbi:MAG: PRD domain-containing protein [Propionicimonas sp.]